MMNTTWHILTIDDDEEDYAITRAMLAEAKGRKIDLDWAPGFEIGREKIFSKQYDAVLIDYDLGLHSGLEIIREATSIGYPAPIILYTGRGSYEVDEEAMQAGATMYLTKSEASTLLLERSIRYAIERKQTEKNLRESEERYRLLFNSMLSGFAHHEIICDEQGRAVDYRFLEINPAFEELTGLKGAEIIGKTVREVLPGIETSWIDTYGEVALTGKTIQFENYAASLDRYYQVFAFSPRKNEFATVFTDITGHKRTEQMLRQSNKDLEQFAFVASHDLQEPLRKIRLFANAVQQKLYGLLDEETLDNFQRMINASERMQAMIHDLLELSRISTQGWSFTRVDLAQVAAEVVSDLEARVHRTRGQVTIEPLPVIEADALQIHQLLQNMIANALKFHKPGTPPVVKVSSQVFHEKNSACQKVRIYIEDNGIGFDEALFDQILQPFKRLQGRSQYEGNGMGLAIVKKIIDRHQGEITAQSQPGEGATFIITLPVKQTS